MKEKSNIRKILIIAVFVLALIGAVYFYFAAPNDGSSSDLSDYSDFGYSDNYSSASDVSDSDSNSNESFDVDNSESESQSSQSAQSTQSEPTSSSQADSQQSTQSSTSDVQKSELKFRSVKLLNQHYEKHGIDMGFSSAQEYEQAAAAVPYHPDVLHKIEKEDGDDVYYIEATNEFVVVSGDGYLRTYFLPSAGKSYYDRQ